MSFSNLEFFIREAWTGFRRSGIMSFISVGIVTVSLIVFGVFLIVILNMGNIVGSIGSKLEIVAYVDNYLDDLQAANLKNQIEKIPVVENIKYISKDEAWKNFKQDFEGRLELGEIIKENPLPNTFIIRVKRPENVVAVAKQISNFPLINEVRYSGRLADRIQVLLNAVRLGGVLLIALLSIATLLIVVNTIRLTVLARQTDIIIMKLVGATDRFIKWPFIIEGIIIGLLGSVLSFITLKFSYDVFISRAQLALPFLPFITDRILLTYIYIAVALVGTLLGMLGGYISVSRLIKDIQ